MSHECKLEEWSTRPALSIRTRTPVEEISQVMGKAYGAIYEYLVELGEKPMDAPFTAYYNMDMQDLDLEIGWPVPRELPGKGDIKASEIPGGKAATCVFTGPYSELGPAYDAISQWIKDNEYEVTGVAYEFYLNDPGETPPAELQTKIAFPLKAD